MSAVHDWHTELNAATAVYNALLKRLAEANHACVALEIRHETATTNGIQYDVLEWYSYAAPMAADPGKEQDNCAKDKETWRSERPTEAGFYWLRNSSFTKEPVIVEVEKSVNGEMVIPELYEEIPLTKIEGGEWYGPLQVPVN